MNFQRAIEFAIDKNTDTILDAAKVFSYAKEGYEIRTQYNSDLLDLHCLKCDQGLMVSDSKNDRLHFKHFPNAGACPLKDGKMTILEVQQFNEMIRCQESDRHKYLKNRIADLLRAEKGVDINSVIADKKFFFGEYEKRRPDVYAEFQEKKLAFEIQLSNLSQRYLLKRTKFYKEQGIYLIWILDQLDVKVQSQMERDIKYLTPYENFFKLDEESEHFKLLCTYKSPFITEENTIIYPWQTKSVSLSQVKFDDAVFQVYYLNFEKALQEKEEELQRILQRKLDQELEQKRVIDERNAERSAAAAFSTFKFYKDNFWNFYKFEEELNKLKPSALEKFLGRVALTGKPYKGKTRINHYISAAVTKQQSFIHFLLRDQRIIFDVNIPNEDGTTTFQEIIRNPELLSEGRIIKCLFKRGYRLMAEDIETFKSGEVNFHDKEAELLRLANFDRLKDRSLVDDVYSHYKVFNFIESAKHQKIIGSGLKNWISFGVHGVLACKAHWSYIELAFRKYRLWELIVSHDKKGSFQRKVSEFYAAMPLQDDSIDAAVRELYPELFG